MTSVFVRGFDYGTTEDDISAHCSSAGSVVSVEMWGQGAAVVTFSSAAGAKSAVKSLNQTTIEGNSRYIDVKINDTTKGGKVAASGGVKRSAPVPSGAGRVFVRGFDFGTTDEQFEAHCSTVGEIVKVQWCTKGSAIVTYSTSAEAEAAVAQLNGTTIEGNSRFIDVIPKEDEDSPPVKKAKGAGKSVGKGVGKGIPGAMFAAGGAWVPMPMMALAQTAWQKPVGLGFSLGKGGGKKGGKKQDPPGSGRVFVRGFDFGTSDEQLLAHMASAGEVSDVHWVTKGSAVVVFKKAGMAKKAVSVLNGTTIDGNSRFIDVILKENE